MNKNKKLTYIRLDILGDQYHALGYMNNDDTVWTELPLKVGDTITDGYKTYVKDRDGKLHYVDSGNHAKYHVSHEELKEMMK